METWLVISNCHTEGLANSLRLLTNDVTIHAPNVWEVLHNTDVYRASCPHYDRVIISPEAEEMKELETFDFSVAKTLYRMPTFYFSAYHPDSMYMYQNGVMVRGPMDVYHSAIAVAAYKKGLSVDETIALFNGSNFEALGYLDYWQAQRAALLKRFADHGIDITPAFLKWCRGKRFMHGVDHPAIAPIYDAASIFLQTHNLPLNGSSYSPPDYLKYPPSFAVYPEIGEALGVAGSYHFKTVGFGTIGLKEFITASYALYDTLDPADVSHSLDKASVLTHIMSL